MTYTPKILAITGSIRKDSYNLKLLKNAIEGAKEAGAHVTLLDLSDYMLPVYDQDFTKETTVGLPENVSKLKQVMRDHDGLLIASPEHNGSVSVILKNVIDWTSRKDSPDEPMLDCWKGKVAAIMSASPGGLGGRVGLDQLRHILTHINVLVLPQQQCIPDAYNVIDEMGMIKDDSKRTAVKNLGKALAEILFKLGSKPRDAL